MKNINSMPWMAYACLLMEALALTFVTLILVCPAPFEHNSLSVIVVQPNFASTTSNATLAPITNNNTFSIPNSSNSSTSTPASSSSTSNLVGISTSSVPTISSTVASKKNTTSPLPTSTTSSVSNVTTAEGTSLPSAGPTLLIRDSSSTSDSFALDVPLHYENTTAGNGTIKEANGDMPRVTQQNQSNSTSMSLSSNITTASSHITSKILLRIGPLGSCFRDSNNTETCTSAKLNSMYDYTQLQQKSNFITSGLPTGMSTYPIVLLVIIVILLFKIIQDIMILFVPTQHIPRFISSPSSGWHSICNWLICIVCLLLAIASGVERNKMGNAVQSFNTANQTITMNSVPLLAQTGTSFGFIWISVLLLAASFLFNRISIKKQAILHRAKQQLLADPSSRYMEQTPLPMYSRTSYNDSKSAPDNKRSSGLKFIRDYLQSNKAEDTSQTPYPGSEISLPTKVLDDYIRRHYHPSDYSDMSKSIQLDYLNDNRRYAKESPPFHAYQSSLDGERESRRQEESNYIEGVRQKMATPAPNYWTMPDREHQDSQQTRREKERQYMAELRRQRSTMD